MKKFISIILVVLMITTLSTVAVSAKGVSHEQSISISKVSDFKIAIVEKLVERTNAKIEDLVVAAMAEEDPDLDLLVARTNFLAQTTIKIAAALGVEVVCEYVVYEINGVAVVIDPLIVIKR
ncbi:MAG: hypothetical protein A2Y17_10565 [Clostridiales bacterium GWF2_38_85]|nr:MAG: hypothetical protein A2Y17_10565 [Clostridiales bacterium GWF2_38_85]HBL84608.1 hypothetical protein [Clostridiales bacterium]